MRTNLTIGTDPEFFIWDNKLGTCVPAIGATCGTKKEPEPWKYGWSLQIDGFALELNSPVYPLVCWDTDNLCTINPIRRDFDGIRRCTYILQSLWL
jgi:hypothetical protein